MVNPFSHGLHFVVRMRMRSYETKVYQILSKAFLSYSWNTGLSDNMPWNKLYYKNINFNKNFSKSSKGDIKVHRGPH